MAKDVSFNACDDVVAQAVQARSAARYMDFIMLAPGFAYAQCAG